MILDSSCFKALSDSMRLLSVMVVMAVLGTTSGCAQQLIHRESQEALRAGEFERAVHVLERGVTDHPESAALRGALVQARTDAVTRLVTAAGSLRSAEKLDEAEAILNRAKTVDKQSARVDALLTELTVHRRQSTALTEAGKLVDDKKFDQALTLTTQALKDNPRHTGLLALRRKLELDAKSLEASGQRRSLREAPPISLDFRDANLRAVLDVVSRSSGINFILDKDIRPDIRVRILLRDATVEDALDLIIGTNQLAKKVIDDETIVVYPNTPEKQREYQEHVVRVFHLASADAKNASAFLKAMLKIREPFVDERSNMIALRDSVENIRLAERLLAIFDAGDPEVLLEVEVIEISSTRLTELGIKFPDSFSLNAIVPGDAASLTLGNIRSLTRDNIALGIGGVSVSLRREVGDFTTLANPRIRARSREKAKVLIGDKIPVVTTTTGIGGFVSDSINYIEVGLKLDVEPTVYADDEVGIKIALEVSSLGSSIRTTSGSIAYQIGTRNASTVLRLRDGETQLLAGLISNDERTNSSRLPGLGDLPLLGRLFSNQLDRGQRSELVLAITPRILRNIRKLDSAEAEMGVGTEALPGLKLPSINRAQARPRADRIAAVGAGSAVVESSQSHGQPLPPTPVVSVRQAKVAMTVSSPSEASVGQFVDVAVRVASTGPLRGLPFNLSFDKQRLEFVSVVEGDFLRKEGAPTSFTHSVDKDNGKVRVGVLRSLGMAAAGEGTVATVKLKVLASGPASVSLDGVQTISEPGTIIELAPMPVHRLTVN